MSTSPISTSNYSEQAAQLLANAQAQEKDGQNSSSVASQNKQAMFQMEQTYVQSFAQATSDASKDPSDPSSTDSSDSSSGQSNFFQQYNSMPQEPKA